MRARTSVADLRSASNTRLGETPALGRSTRALTGYGKRLGPDDAPQRPLQPLPYIPGFGTTPLHRRRKLTRALTAAEKRAMLVVAGVLSLLLHTCLVVAIYDTPMATIDPTALVDDTRWYQLHRGDDMIMEEPPQLADAPPDAQSVAEASKELVQNAAPELAPLPSTAALPPPRLAGQLTAEPSREQTPLEAQADPSPFEISNQQLSELGTEAPIELPFQELAERPGALGAGVPSGGGRRGGGRGLGPDGGTGAAQSLLDAAAGSNVAAGRAMAGLDRSLDPVPSAIDRIDAAALNFPDNRGGANLDFNQFSNNMQQALATESLDNDFDYSLSTYQKAGEPGYFRVDIKPKGSLRKLRTLPKDVVFLLDTSASISQAWVEEMIAGVSESISNLNASDRFNIVFFSDKPSFFDAKEIQPATVENIARAKQFLKSGRSGGTTDVNLAISRLLVRDASQQRVYNLVLMSDGVPTRGLMNTRDLINLITKDNDLVASIYCVAVGKKVNTELLNFLSYRNKGHSVVADQPRNVRNAVRDLLSDLRYPIIRDMRVDVAGIDPTQVFPITVPDIHQGQTVSIFGRYDKPGEFTMRLTGHNGEKRLDFTFIKQIPEKPGKDEEIATQWAFWKLHHLYSEIIRTGDEARIKAQIEELRQKYNLKTVY